MKKTILFFLTISFLLITFKVAAQHIDSTNYRIKDVSVDAGTGAANSANYSVLGTINGILDPRLTSSNYELKAGFPNGILANVPIVKCFETTTNSGTTSCTLFPHSNGATGECGDPGCYNRAKIELDDQNNPYDTLYLVKVDDVINSVTYYLKSDHTLGTTFDITNFLDQCDLEGRDASTTACDDSGDARWNAVLQRYNIYGLKANTNYSVSVSALNGDFTGTRFSQTVSATTADPSITFDIDISSSLSAETAAPYALSLGELNYLTVTTAGEYILLDLGTNTNNGASIYVRDINSELASAITGETIPSESEDLATDPNNNGGYGIKINAATATSLGPLQKAAAYDTGGTDIVGKLFPTNQLLFFTDTTGANNGPISGGRGSIFVKARPIAIDKSAQDLSDDITLIAVGNF